MENKQPLNAHKSRATDAREIAYLTLLQVEKDGAYVNLALKKVLDGAALSAQDARLASQLVYGTTRQRAALDHILKQLLTQPLNTLALEVHLILNMALYQLYYLNNVQPYAVVDQAVRLTKRFASPRLAALCNAVLRNYLRRDEQPGQHERWLPDRSDMRRYLSITLSYPRWLCDYLIENIGLKEAEQFCLAGNQPAPLCLRTNLLRVEREQLMQTLAGQGIVSEPYALAPETLRVSSGGNRIAHCAAFRSGDFIIQGAASQLVAHALSPRPGSLVYDLCAAPGGKSTHLAQLMHNQGRVLAFDLHPHKLKLIESNAKRLGCTIIETQAANSCCLPAHLHNKADYVLLDAPCSGLGVLNARADNRWHKQRADIRPLADLSFELLKAAGTYLKPGGLLCYSTCTVTHEENADNLRRFLAAYPQFELAPLENLVPCLQREEDIAAARSGMLQLWPQRHGVEGFFISLLRRRA